MAVFWKRVPANEETRKAWENILNVELKGEQYICSDHFTSSNDEKPSECLDGKYWTIQNSDRLDRHLKRQKVFEESEMKVDSIQSSKDAQIDSLNEKIKQLEEQLTILKDSETKLTQENLILRNKIKELCEKEPQRKPFDIQDFRNDSDKLKHFITFKDYNQFEELVREVHKKVEESGGLTTLIKGKETKYEKKKKISVVDMVSIVLIRSRRGFKIQTIAILFMLSQGYIQKIITVIAPIVRDCLKKYVVLSRNIALEHRPLAVSQSYPSLVLLTDCTYIYIQHSHCFALQHATFSSHKNKNLIKVILWTYADGTIARVSGMFGSDDDKYITEIDLKDEAFNNFFQPGDLVCTDRGFRIGDILSKLDVGLIQPEFLHGKDQFTPEQIKSSRLITSIRSVNENANARLKSQRILQYPFDNKELSNLEVWIQIAAALSNLCYKPLREPNLLPVPKLVPSSTFLTNDTINLPDKSSFSRTINPYDFPVLTLDDIFSICQTPTISNKPKSTMDRALKYLQGPNPRLTSLNQIRGDRTILRARCISSFKGVNSKKHLILFEVKDGFITFCSCKNGRLNCSHIAALFIRLWELQTGELFTTSNSINEQNLQLLKTKRMDVGEQD